MVRQTFATVLKHRHTVSSIELVDNSFNCSFMSSFGWFVTYLQKVFTLSVNQIWQMLALQIRRQPLILLEALYHSAEGGFWCFRHHRYYNLLEVLAYFWIENTETWYNIVRIEPIWVSSFSTVKKAWLLDSWKSVTSLVVNLMHNVLSISSITSCNSKSQFATEWITLSRVCRVAFTRLEMIVKSKFWD